MYKVAIIGSGPAGLTAGIYMARAKFSTILIEGLLPGGQMMTTTKVENWPGNTEIMGPDLMENMLKHAANSGCKTISGVVERVSFDNKPFTLFYDNNKTIEAESIIVAAGSSHKKLGCKGEAEYWGSGVSVCATCDAPFYEGKNVVVVGGGNSAMVEAEHIAHFAKKVTIIHILDELTANDPIKFKVLENPKITIQYHAIVKEIQGDGLGVTQILVEDTKTKDVATIKADGIFIAIGLVPNTTLFKNILEMDTHGYLTVHNGTSTSKPGIFAAGEVSDFRYRQAITSAGLGCMAALDCQSYLNTIK